MRSAVKETGVIEIIVTLRLTRVPCVEVVFDSDAILMV